MISKEMISIDIGSHTIKLVVGKHLKNGMVEVKEAHSVNTPEGSIEDGKILDFNRLKEALEVLMMEKKSKAKGAIFTVQSTEAITREVTLPLVKPSEMKDMVHMEIYQYFPVNLDEYIVEHKIIHEFMENDIKKANIMVAALPKMIVEEYLQMATELRLKPVAMDINSNAIAKLFLPENNNIVNDHKTQNKTIAILDIGVSQINLHIISQGIMQFSRIIDQNRMEDMNEFLDEINRYFQFYTSRKTDNQIDSIYIMGGNSKNQGVHKLISESVNIPTFPIIKMSQVKNEDSIHLAEFLNAIGALIRK